MTKWKQWKTKLWLCIDDVGENDGAQDRTKSIDLLPQILFLSSNLKCKLTEKYVIHSEVKSKV